MWITYHSPGRPRSSWRSASTGSTAGAASAKLLVVVGGVGVGFGFAVVSLGVRVKAFALGGRDGLFDLVSLGAVFFLDLLGVDGSLFGRLARRGVSGFGLVWLDSVRRLDDVGFVLSGLDRLAGVVQVRVRHGGCFFLAKWVAHAKGAPRRAPSRDQPKTYLIALLKP